MFCQLPSEDRIFGGVADKVVCSLAICDFGQFAKEHFFLIASQSFSEFLAACKTVVGIFGQSTLQRDVDIFRDVFHRVSKFGWRIRLMFVQKFLLCFTMEQRLTGDQFIKHCRQCVLVGTPIDGQPVGLFWCGIGGSASKAGSVVVVGKVASDAEIQNLVFARRGATNIFRFQVAMNDPLSMSKIQSPRKTGDHIQRLVQTELALFFCQVTKVASVDIFKNGIGSTGVKSKIVYGSDAGVIQVRTQFGFAGQHRLVKIVLVVDTASRDDFNCHLAI